MEIESHTVKRGLTLTERRPDFARAADVFSGPHVSISDLRQDYEDPRWMTVGWLEGRVVVIVWTSSGEVCRIIRMRKANERDIEKFSPRLG